ncbi:hypothetical protein D1841_02705 [Neglecta sp. X4]|nr:hypothetical protein [Neglectibacter sp. 59]NBJ72262.1 hypothetical protein [Neglectibacter sp. X4]NCE79985.1 hypothetical protein [Neglectibacter sp. X58]
MWGIKSGTRKASAWGSLWPGRWQTCCIRGILRAALPCAASTRWHFTPLTAQSRKMKILTARRRGITATAYRISGAGLTAKTTCDVPALTVPHAGFTLRTYTHATRQKQEQAAEKMGNFMEKVM